MAANNTLRLIIEDEVDERASLFGGKGPVDSYSYTADLIMGLCEGPINSIGYVYKNQSIYLLAQLGLGNYNGTPSYPVTILQGIKDAVGTNAEGTASIDQDSGGQFSDNSTIKVEVQKTCSTSVTEAATYTLSGHL